MQIDNSPPSSIWLIPPADLDLQPHQVDIWRAFLAFSDDSLDLLEMTLSVDENQRAARFHFQEDKDRFIAAHGCLRDILMQYLHCEPGQLSFSAGPYGKPCLSKNSFDPGLEFNLTHSGNYALVAVTWQRKVGVDLECIRQGISTERIAGHYFSQREVSELMALPSKQREVAFFKCWTRKEAYMKAIGLGLSLPLDSFDVSLNPAEPAILRATRPDPQEVARWSLLSLEVDSGFASAVAVEGQGLEFRLWDWKMNWK
jgi:4'-phosphopantetheinyl transferase